MRALFVALAILIAGAVSAQVPDTPAGRQFLAWRKAMDSGDRGTVATYLDKYWPVAAGLDQAMANTAASGGYDVRKVEESTDTRLVLLAQERGGALNFVRITMIVSPSEPYRILGVQVARAQPPKGMGPRKLTAAEIEAAQNAPAFRQFSAWLDAFNTGDRDRIAEFLTANFPSRPLDGEMNFRERTAGFEFRAIEQATPTSVTGLVQATGADGFARFSVVVEPVEPHKIVRMSVLVVPRPAEFAVPRLSEGETIAALRTKIEKDAAADRFAGTVLVGRIGQATNTVLFSEAYGLADRERKVANTLDTRFRLGSMNKMFTAVSILQLVQAGKIKLSDPVGKYIKDYPNQAIATKVTIHHLLTHTGGTGDFFGPLYNEHKSELRTLDDYIALYGKRDPLFNAGSRYAYSNYGMLLLGVVIERVSGKSYYDYVDENIFRMAGMTHTGSEPEGTAVRDRAIGYMRPQGRGEWTPNTTTLGYRGTSAGGGYSTVGDLLRFASALMNHQLLNAKYTDLLIKGKVATGAGHMYAYGFDDARKGADGSVGHSGGAPGMSGDLRIYPRSGYVIAVLSNLDPPAAPQVSAFVDMRLPR
jgi:CubicO group peptidase (beta-lactamase class C family)